jgi:hypothetical protein
MNPPIERRKEYYSNSTSCYFVNQVVRFPFLQP